MPTIPFGDATLYSLVRHRIEPLITDVAYRGTPLTYRLLRGNRKVVTGAPHIEFPVMYQDVAGGDWLSGYDAIAASPSDTVKNAYTEFKRLTVPMVIDSDTLFKANNAEAVANIVVLQSEQARMRAQNLLATAVMQSTGSNAKAIVGLPLAVDSTGTYLGIDRASNSWWAANEDASTTALSLSALNSMFNNCSEGGRHPSIIISGTAHYEAFWNLGTPYVSQDLGPTGRDEQLFAAGFTNLLFNGVPWVRDPLVTADGATSRNPIFFLNEDYWDLYVGQGQDFAMGEFMRPWNQQVYVAEINWRGALVCRNPKRQGKLTNIA